jgi:hypothetical protein
MFLKIDFLLHGKCPVFPFQKTSHSVLFREIITVYSENFKKPINISHVISMLPLMFYAINKISIPYNTTLICVLDKAANISATCFNHQVVRNPASTHTHTHTQSYCKIMSKMATSVLNE